MLTRLFGLPLNVPLMACHIMKLLQGMILMPSGNIVQFKKKPYGSLLPFGRALIILLLILSGNVHVHPGPAVTVNPISAAAPGPDANPCLEGISFTNFCSRKALGFLHIYSRSLLSKIDQLKLWTHSSNPDILVVTESWLKKSVPDSVVDIIGYNVIRQDRSYKGGGVAIFVKEHLQSPNSFTYLFSTLN